jgi:Flp pilus assembly pilin Flp
MVFRSLSFISGGFIMSKIISALQRFLQDEEGQDIIEYGLLAAFIAIAVAGLLFLFSDQLKTIYQAILNALSTAGSVAGGSTTGGGTTGG